MAAPRGNIDDPGHFAGAAPAAAAGQAGPAEAAYYLENGLVVFTAAHHLARGCCCGSGCRHCPYDPPHAAGTRKVR